VRGLAAESERGEGGASGSSASAQSNTLATSVHGDPWAIFVDNISALYYF
jgi:hypothetical protein